MSDYGDLDAVDDLDDSGELGDLGDDAWDDGFGRGWTAAQNAVPACCLHGEDCPRRRPRSGSRVLAWLRGDHS